MGLLDRVRRRQRGAGRPGVPQRDSAAGGTRGGGPRARGLHVVRRGHRVRDRPVAVRGVRARGRVDRERLAPTAANANRARRMGAPDLRRLLDHRRRAAHTAHGLDPGRRAGAGRATGRRTLGECALRSRGAQATGRAAAHRARDGGPGRNGAGARDQLFPHVRRPARHPWRRDREHRGGGGGGGRGAHDDRVGYRPGAARGADPDAARVTCSGRAVDTCDRQPRAYDQCFGGLTANDSFLGGGGDGDFPGDPGAGGDRDRAVLRGGGARVTHLLAHPRAPRRARRDRPETARGHDPDGGGEPGRHVARPARPDREGGGRGRGTARRPGRAVRGGARGGRDDRARRGGHAPQRAARPVGARVGAARAQAPEEALKAGQLVAATAAALAGIVLLPAVAHAWTPGTHVYLGESVLANLHQLPTAVADLLRAFPFDYLYGNIAADTSLAKKYAPVGRHCHAWHVGQEIFDLAPTDPLRAFGLGYLSHLAADAVAHNFFVPRQLVLTSSTTALGHSYWESRFETHLGDAYAKEAKEVIQRDHTPSDTHLDSIISPTLFSMGTNRRLFRGMVHLTESESWRWAFQLILENTRWDLPDADVERHMAVAFEYVMEMLGEKDAAARRLDPAGDQALKLAKRMRRQALHEGGREDPERMLETAEHHFGLPTPPLAYWKQSEAQRPWRDREQG